jgi:hypothetical protein
MTERLHYTTVRPIADRINRLAGISVTGAPLRGRKDWIEGALTLESGGYGTWSVCRVTSKRGGCTDVHRGKLRDCKAYLEGIEHGLKLTLRKGNTYD